jgi:Tfp pilus assembly protein PilF
MGLLFTIGGCGSLPRIVVLHDPLTPQEHVQLGVSYESQKDWASAEKQYQAALAQDPDFLPALANLGNVYAQQEQYASAEKMYRRALHLDPNNSMVNNNLAWIYVVQGIHLDEAGERIDRALARDPGHRAFYEDTRALLFLSLGQPGQAQAASFRAESASGSDLPGFAQQHNVTRSKIEAAMAARGTKGTEVP